MGKCFEGMETPWGVAQTVTVIADGIESVSTSSHGGIRLSAERQAQMPERFVGLNKYGRGCWYEEDCEWALVAVAFPEHFLDCLDDAVRVLWSVYGLKVGDDVLRMSREGK